MNQSEIQRFVEESKPFKGARLQDVQSTERMLVLCFYHGQALYWWIIDLKPALPVIVVSSELPKILKLKTTPLQLFLKAHFVGHRLRDVVCDKTVDRVVILEFPERRLELRLFPHGQNVIAKAPDKTISWEKVAELRGAQSPEEKKYEARSNLELAGEWFETLQTKTNKTQTQDLSKILEKKRNALAEMKKNLGSDESSELRKQGLLLQIDGDIEKAQVAFEKAKKLEYKIEGTADRVEKLKKEIALLEAGEMPKKVLPSKIMEKSEAKARRIMIAEKYELLIGKSGADNLKILRKAAAYDYWLHLRDYPGAHGILHRNKMKEISDSDLTEALQRFISESQSAKTAFRDGDPIDVVVCECRFVRPIKGDKLGRVNYQNERIIRVRFEAKR